MSHLAIFGDNKIVLSSEALQKFKNRIKLVYIDPPYNTKVSKSYIDKLDSASWLESITTVLKLLHSYLQQNGVIFISIDDNEYAELKLACDAIFGKVNFVGTFITKQAQRSNSKFINIVHEYILCYARDKTRIDRFVVKRMDIPEQRYMINDISLQVKKEVLLGVDAAEKKLMLLIEKYCKQYDISWLKNYNCVDNNGDVYFASDLSVPGEPRRVDIDRINLHLEPLKTRGWASDKRFIELYEKNLLVFRNGRPYYKKLLKDAEDNASSILNFYSRFGTNDLNKLGLRGLFDTPKPVALIKYLIRLANVKDGEYVLDCYAGSGTTGQAVMEVNFEDQVNINFILIQRKETVISSTRTYQCCKKYGVAPFISEISKLRIHKVCEQYNMAQKVEYINYE